MINYIKQFLVGDSEGVINNFCNYLTELIKNLPIEGFYSYYTDYNTDGNLCEVIRKYNSEHNTNLYIHVGINKCGLLITKLIDSVEVKVKRGYGLDWEVSVFPIPVPVLKKDIIDLGKCPKNEYVDIYYPDGTLIAHTNNDLEFSWILLQIGELELEGCYIEFNGQRENIEKGGWLSYQPIGCMDNLERVIGRHFDLDPAALPDSYKYKPFDKIQIISNGSKGIIKTKHWDGVEVIFDINAPTEYYKYDEIRKI